MMHKATVIENDEARILVGYLKELLEFKKEADPHKNTAKETKWLHLEAMIDDLEKIIKGG